MKKQKKKSLQIVKRIVTLFLILAITSTQIEPSVFAASSDGQWASESLKEDAVTENESADATADSTGTSNTDESHTDESETEKKPETTDGTAQDPGNTDNTDGTAQNPDNTDNTDKTTQDPGNADTTGGTAQNPGNADTTDGTTQDPGNADTTDGSTQDQDNTDNADKTEQDPETTVTEEQLTEETDENLSAADAVLPVEISYYLPKFQELKIEAPEEYTDTEQQEEARAAVTDQAMADETTQKLLEQADKDAESADTDESAVDTQALTESAVSEEEYVSYTQMAVTGDTLAAPAVSLPDDVQLDPEADPEDTDPLIGWQVAKLAGIVLSYADGTKINEGDVIPADQINEVSAAAADDGIALMSIDASALAKLIALTQDMTVVQRVGSAGTNGKWSILVQGGTNKTDTAGTVRHAYGTIAKAFEAINKDTDSDSFKITLLDDYTTTDADRDAMGTTVGGSIQKRTSRPTIVITGAVNYQKGTSYENWNKLTLNGNVYFSNFDAYITCINIYGNRKSINGNGNNTSFVNVNVVSTITNINGGGNGVATTENYTLTLDHVTTTKAAPVKYVYGGSAYVNSGGNITLQITDSVIYGTVCGTGFCSNGNGNTHTGNVLMKITNTSVYAYGTPNMLNRSTMESAGGAVWGSLDMAVTGNVTINVNGNYYAQCGTWYTMEGKISGDASMYFSIKNASLNNLGSYTDTAVGNNTTAKKRTISINKTYGAVADKINVTNIFGWNRLELHNCSTSSEQNFGHIQYNSSYYNYMTKVGATGVGAALSTYTPDLNINQNVGGAGDYIYTTEINSVNDVKAGYWSRQYFGAVKSSDAKNSVAVYNNGISQTSNLVHMSSLSAMSTSYKIRLKVSVSAISTNLTNAASYLKIDELASQSNSALYLSNRFQADPSTQVFTASGTYVKTYDTSGDYAMTLYKEGSNSNTYVAKGATFSGILSSLRSQNAGNYIIEVRKCYTLLDDDVTAFNNATGLTNKNVTVTMAAGAGWLAGGNLNSQSSSYRWSNIYPQFQSLTWKNLSFRGDAFTGKDSYTFRGNGRPITFQNCVFGNGTAASIEGGGTGAQGRNTNVTVKNCRGLDTIYSTLGTKVSANGTVTVISCTGAKGTLRIMPTPGMDSSNKYTGDVNVTVENCTANISPIYRNYREIQGNYNLTVTDSNVQFMVPEVLSTKKATVYLKGNVTLTGDCYGSNLSSSGTSEIHVYGKVKTKEDTLLGIYNFDSIYIEKDSSIASADTPELRLGNIATKQEARIGGKSTSSGANRLANVYLKDGGKFVLDWADSSYIYRQIQSLTTDATDTELSVTYDYTEGTSSPTGRPLYIQSKLTANNALRISTGLRPTHAGTVAYPLVHFNDRNNAKLSQFNWIADQRYYLRIRTSDYQTIELIKDEYAPQVYQLKSSGVSLNGTDGLMACIDIYLRDPDRDAIDKKGSTLNDASNGAYPEGVQVYLSSQDVQKKDGVYDYVYNIEEGDKQLNKNNTTAVITYNQLNAGETFTDINGQTISSTSESPIIHIRTAQLLFYSNKNYFIYARDIAGNWSKFLLDTKGPKLNKETWKQTLSYIDKAATTQETNATYYVDAEYEDVQQSAVNDGTSDINNIGYFANATKYINANKNYAEVRWNTSDKNPWDSFNPVKFTEVTRGSDGKYRLKAKSADLGYAYSPLKTLYVFVRDAYGNISKYEFMPVVYDASRNKDGSTGYFSGFGSFAHTMCLKGETLSQTPKTPFLESTTSAFRYWYDASDSAKKAVNLSTTLINKPTKFYPMWKNPVFTITQKVKGDGVNKEQSYEYIVTILEDQSDDNPIANTTIECVPGTVSGSDASAPTITQITTDAEGEATLSLKPNQTIQLKVERLKYGINVYPKTRGFDVVQETGGGYNTSSNLLINETSNGLIFTHTQNIVVTGISDGLNSKTLPIVGLAAAVVMLGASALMLKRRRRS